MVKNPTIKRFMNVKVAVAGLIIIITFMLIAIFAYILSPDSTPFSNDQNITLANLRPGSKITFIKITKNDKPSEKSFISKFLTGFPNTSRHIPIKKYSIENDSLILIEYGSTDSIKFISRYHIADIFYAIGSKEIKEETNFYSFKTVEGKAKKISKSEIVQNIESKAISNKTFLLGTDRFGRDMLSRIIVGSRISISVGFIAVLISLIIGIVLGLIGGYYEGVIDRFIMWLINVVWSIPTLLLVIAISMVLGKGFWQIFIAVGLTMWVEVARVVRGQVKSIKEKDFVQAARVLGFPNFRIMFRHILPNTTGPLIVISAANFATAILLEAGLSFLGIGVQPPVPSWGNMIRDHYGYIVVDQAYLAIAPGIAIMLLVWAFNVVGYGLRDALDVKS